MKRNPFPPAADPGRNGFAPLKPVELETIQFFVQLSRALGQPSSVAEIYGLLFISPRPLPQDDFTGRLNLSKGSASQGLKYLSDLGAVRTVSVANDRRMHYEAVAELRQLVGSFLQKQVDAHFRNGGSHLDRITSAAQELTGEDRKFVAGRIKKLRNWEKSGRRLLPFVLKLLGSK